MPITEVIVSCVYSTQMVIAVLFAINYKREKKHIPLLVLANVVDYIIVNYLSLRNETWMLAFFFEIIFFIAIIGLFAEGNMWRNYIIVWINFQFANILISLEYYIINLFTESKTGVIFFGTTSIPHIIFDWFLMLINALLALIISKKVFKSDYRGGGTVYKIAVLVMTIGTAYISVKRSILILEERQYPDVHGTSKILNIYLITIIGMMVVLFLSGYLYNLLEMKRLSKEKKTLQNILEQNHKRYMSILENNKGLEAFRDMLRKGDIQLTEKLATESVSGNLLLDTVILINMNNFEEQEIVFERIIPPMKDNLSRDKTLATVVDLLLKIAEQSNKSVHEQKWIFLMLKNINENTIVKLEFSKSKRKLKSTYELRLLRKIIYSADGTMNIKDNGKDIEISVLV